MCAADRAVVRGLGCGALAVLVSCGPRQVEPARPRISAQFVGGQVFGLGEPIPVSASWQGTCEETNRYDEVTGTAPCAERAHAAEITCDGPCEREPVVAALAPGAFAFTVKLVAVDGEESPVYRTPTVEIRPPDALELYCYYPEFDALTDQPRPPVALSRCDDRPLTAAMPWVQVRARLGDRTYRTYAAALEDRRGLTWARQQTDEASEPMASLAEVLAAPGAALAPGRYQVTVTLGALTTTVALAVAP